MYGITVLRLYENSDLRGVEIQALLEDNITTIPTLTEFLRVFNKLTNRNYTQEMIYLKTVYEGGRIY